MNTNTKTSSPVVLVPGLWLGGWAWDAVAEHLSRRGVPAAAVTLPGLESPTARRDGIGLVDHVSALVGAIHDAGSPVVLVAHSGAGVLATAVLDQAPETVRRVVYVDSGPVADGTVARPDLGPETTEVPLPSWAQLEAAGASLDGLDEHALRRFRDRAVPHPAGPLREPVSLHDPARNQVPATVVCCSFPSAAIREMVTAPGMFAPSADLTDLEYLDLPTGHWPMWSAPEALADIIAATARR
ncbi:MAG: alpha/beta hydrolase [Micrococcales bacterium]|nr:alpha/beta hydrolase [Micrococcales bacterium]